MRRFSFGALAIVLALTFASVALAAKPTPAPQKPTVQFKNGSGNVNESKTTASVQITLSSRGTGDVHVRTAGGTATGDSACGAGVDYVTFADKTVHFANQSDQQVAVTLCPDAVDEANETIILQLFNQDPGWNLGSKREIPLTITDDDPSPRLAVSDASPATTPEGSDMTFTVSRTGATSALPVTVVYTAVSGTATSGSDFPVTTGTLGWGPGDNSNRTVTVHANDDALDEADEGLTLVLSSPTNAGITDASGAGTISDTDDPPAISIADGADAEDDGFVQLEVTLDGPAAQTVTVDWTTAANGSATAQPFGPTNSCLFTQNDYVSATGTVTFAAGDQSETILVPTCPDTDLESDETFSVFLMNPTYATTVTDGTGVGTILNDDPPNMSIADSSADEDGPLDNGGTISFTVTLDQPTVDTVTVDWATVDGTAGGGAACDDPGSSDGSVDYISANDTLTFDPGQTSKQIDVLTCSDGVGDDGETFDVQLSSLSAGAAFADDLATGTLFD